MKDFWRTSTVLIGTILMVASVLTPASAADPPPAWPAHWKSAPPPPVQVAQAQACDFDDLLVITGGFTDTLEATAAIQLKSARHGWMPIGQAMLRSRAGHSMISIDEERILVIGGWEGVLPDNTTPHHDAEIIEPRHPERRRMLEIPLPELNEKGLIGHSVTQLSDGQILLVCDGHAVVFNPKDEKWSPPILLSHPRRHHAACSPDGKSVLIFGGNFPPESIQPDEKGYFQSVPWNASGPSVLHASMVPFGSGKAILVGGETENGTYPESTWILDPRLSTITPGPTLPKGEGMRDPILIPTAIGILIAGGERFSSEGLRNISQPLILQPERNRIWSVPAPPEQFLYQSVVSRINGTIDLIGGYRFSRNTGIQLNSNTDRIVLPQLAICD